MPDESEIIAKIRSQAKTADDLRVGIGDDAAVFRHNRSTHLLVCSDLSVEGIHFRADWTEPYLIGRKALAVTLSDIAAMGGTPRYALLSIALPPATPAKSVDEILRGVCEIAGQYDVAIVGGDTSASPSALFIDTTVIGEVPRRKAVTRSGAKATDIIFVTGGLGASALGLKLLELGHRLYDEPDADTFFSLTEMRRQAIRKHLVPEPRLEFGQMLSDHDLATAMIDISDGLSTDLSHILDESDCGALLRMARVPVASCVTGLAIAGMEMDPMSLALHGGEEYELLFTSPPETQEEIFATFRQTGIPVTAIGRITEERGLKIERNGTIELLKPSGYEHKI